MLGEFCSFSKKSDEKTFLVYGVIGKYISYIWSYCHTVDTPPTLLTLCQPQLIGMEDYASKRTVMADN